MIDLRNLDRYRLAGEWNAPPGHPDRRLFGVFNVPSCIDKGSLRVIASNDAGWDHVSVSRQNRCPNWPEMSQIKEMFFAPDEPAMQLHPTRDNWVNNHPYCLHLWRPHSTHGAIPMPPAVMVGIREAGTFRNKDEADAAYRKWLAGRTVEQAAAEELGRIAP